jgi:hypothetical protein
MYSHEPVDAVITWVDGADATRAKKLDHYLMTQGLEPRGPAAPTRFSSCGEIDYCIRSILYFAPWIRTIHVVTDEQTPSFLSTLRGTEHEKKIKIVDHRALFQAFEHHLPTFNSLTIESMLWRIPELSEQFIYFNDDCFIIQPVDYHDFFIKEKLLLRGEWKTPSEKKWRSKCLRALSWLRQRPYRPRDWGDYRILQEKTAYLLGFKRRFFHLLHVPLPMKNQIFVDFFVKHPEQLEQNIRYKLRDLAQFMPFSLAYHLGIRQKQVVFDQRLTGISVHAGHHSLQTIAKRLGRADRNKRIAFICIQSLDEGNAAKQRHLRHWLDQRIPMINP